MIYLDTHCIVWLFNGESVRFSPAALARLEDEDVRISPISVLELELLHEIGRLTLPAQQIIQKLKDYGGIDVCDRPFGDVALAATWLKWTHDPFDRMLCGHVLAAGGELLTKDETIRRHFPRAWW